MCACGRAIHRPLGGEARGLPRPGRHRADRALVVIDTSLWWFDGYCRIGKMYKAKAVHVQVHCGAKDVPVTLDAQGDCMRVNWGTAYAEELKRCN